MSREGTKNRTTKALRASLQDLCWEVGYDPVMDIIQISQMPDLSIETRLECAKILLPYLHPKLAQVKVQGDADAPLVIKMVDFRSEFSDPAL